MGLCFAVIDQPPEHSSRFLENYASDEIDRVRIIIYTISLHYSEYKMIIAYIVTIEVVPMFI